jgi:translation initiation factor 2 beta subunit (eIF-2beta)/eIF-5
VSALHSSAERFKTGSGSELVRGTGGAGTAGGSSKGGTVNNKLKVCLQLNRLLKRLDQFCNQFVECDTEEMIDDTIVSGEMTSSMNKPEAAVGSVG